MRGSGRSSVEALRACSLQVGPAGAGHRPSVAETGAGRPGRPAPVVRALRLPRQRRRRAAVHAGHRDRRERPAEGVDEDGHQLALRRQAALEHVHRVGERVALDLRVLEHDDGVLGRLVAGLHERDHGVRRVVGEAVLALVPLVDELLGGEVPYDALRAVGEVEGGGRQLVEGHRSPSVVSSWAVCANRASMSSSCLLDVVGHGVSRLGVGLSGCVRQRMLPVGNGLAAFSDVVAGQRGSSAPGEERMAVWRSCQAADAKGRTCRRPSPSPDATSACTSACGRCSCAGSCARSASR